MKVVNGDLISLAEEGIFDVIVHGCNCFCTMNSGIARQIRERYPEAYQADCNTEKGDRSKLGSFSSVDVGENHRFTIVNAYTQYHYGRGKRHADYDAISAVFNRIRKVYSGKQIGYPLIGAGLAGGDWNEIESIIQSSLRGQNHTLVKFKPS